MLKLNFKEGSKRNRNKFLSIGTVNADPMQKVWEEKLTKSPERKSSGKIKLKNPSQTVFEALISASSF
jgi:hypothetical protein